VIVSYAWTNLYKHRFNETRTSDTTKYVNSASHQISLTDRTHLHHLPQPEPYWRDRHMAINVVGAHVWSHTFGSIILSIVCTMRYHILGFLNQ
jgi:hypothetical protein